MTGANRAFLFGEWMESEKRGHVMVHAPEGGKREESSTCKAQCECECGRYDVERLSEWRSIMSVWCSECSKFPRNLSFSILISFLISPRLISMNAMPYFYRLQMKNEKRSGG